MVFFAALNLKPCRTGGCQVAPDFGQWRRKCVALLCPLSAVYIRRDCHIAGNMSAILSIPYQPNLTPAHQAEINRKSMRSPFKDI